MKCRFNQVLGTAHDQLRKELAPAQVRFVSIKICKRGGLTAFTAGSVLIMQQLLFVRRNECEERKK